MSSCFLALSCLPSLTSFSGRRVFVTPAEATRVGCYCHRQVRSRVVVTVMKMMLLSAIAVSGAALPEAPGGTPAPAEAALAPAQSDNSTSTSGRRGSRWGRRDLNHVAVNEQGHPCLPNPLWERKVDPAKYEFGCTEIEVSRLTSVPRSRMLHFFPWVSSRKHIKHRLSLPQEESWRIHNQVPWQEERKLENTVPHIKQVSWPTR